jgi:hypothetical protein
MARVPAPRIQIGNALVKCWQALVKFNLSSPDYYFSWLKNIKITCCVQRQVYAGRCLFFSKMNYALEE